MRITSEDKKLSVIQLSIFTIMLLILGSIIHYNQNLPIEEPNLTHFHLGNNYYDNNDWSNAIIEYEKHLEQFPKHQSSMYNIGLSYTNLGAEEYSRKNYQNAINLYHRALIYSPKDIRTHYMLGLAYRDIDELNLAIENFKEAINYGYKKPHIYNLVSTILLDAKEFNLLVEFFEELTLENPNNSIFYQEIGKGYINLKEVQLAISNLKKAIEIDSSDIYSYILLEEAYLLDNRKSDIISLYLDTINSIDNIGTRAKLEVELGRVYYDFANYTETIKILEQVIKNNPLETSAYQYLIKAKRQTNDRKGLKATFKKSQLANEELARISQEKDKK